MNEQLAFSLAAASVGFVAAVFFCIGNALNTADKIFLQSCPFYDFSEPMARALTAQRAQYIVGAVLLVVSFFLQVAAVLASSTTPAALLPSLLHTWPNLVLGVLLLTGLVAGGFSFVLYETTMQRILRLLAADLAAEALKKLPPPKS